MDVNVCCLNGPTRDLAPYAKVYTAGGWRISGVAHFMGGGASAGGGTIHGGVGISLAGV